MQGLSRLRNMWLDPKVLFYDNLLPEMFTTLCPAVFLAGPTSRDGIPDYMWRKDAIHYLRSNGYDSYILVPEHRGQSYLSHDASGDDFTDTVDVHQWEYDGLWRATYRLFWIPRNLQQLLGITTNREFAQWTARAESSPEISRSLFIGWPDDAKKMGSMRFELEKSNVGHKKGDHFTSLEELCKKLASEAVFEDTLPI